MADKKSTWTPRRDFSDKNDQQILEVILEDEKTSKAYCQPYIDRFINYYQLYRSFIKKEDIRPHGANLFIPRAFDCIETVTPRIVSALLGSRPVMGIYSLRDTPDDELKARKMETLMDYQAEQKMLLRYKLALLVKDALIYGTSVGKMTWKLVRKSRVSRAPKMQGEARVGIEPVREEVIVYDAPNVEHIDIFNVIVDKDFDNIEDMRFFGYRYSEDIDAIQQKAADGIYDEKRVKAFIEDVGGVENTAQASSERRGDAQRLSSIELGGSDTDQKAVQLKDYWTDDWHVVVANDKYILKLEENPYDISAKPFFSIHDCPISGEFFAIGEIEPIEFLIKELNTTRNQRIDNVSMVLNRMWMVIENSGIKPADLVSRPNGIINVPDMECIKEVQMTDVSESGYKEEPIIKEDIDRTVGVFDYTRGSQLERRETATTTTVMSEAANLRFKLKLDMISMSSMKQLGRLWVALNQQYIDHDINISVLDEDGKRLYDTISCYDILGEFDVIPAASATEPTVNKDSIINQFGQMVPNVINNPVINQPLFFKEFFRAMGFKSVDRMVYDDPSQNPLAQQQAPADDGTGEQAVIPSEGQAEGQVMQTPDGGTLEPMGGAEQPVDMSGITIEQIAPLLQELIADPGTPQEIKAVFQQTLDTGVITDECIQILEAIANTQGAQMGGGGQPQPVM